MNVPNDFNEFPILVPAEYMELLRDWHGGQWSAFYSLLSTGEIADEHYLSSALLEAYSCQKYAVNNDTKEQLNSFVLWLEKLENKMEQS